VRRSSALLALAGLAGLTLAAAPPPDTTVGTGGSYGPAADTVTAEDPEPGTSA
jgi:hypothetical protein